MAEYSFQEVMKQARRMCAKYPSCRGCRLDNLKCMTSPDGWGDEDIAAFERIVMDWAAAHPEPQYPTWREYLDKVGMWKMASGAMRDDWITNTHIPADIAEKLGVKPKEEK